MFFMPEVPGIGWGAGRDINTLSRFVKTNLVFPLLVIDLWLSVASTVQGNKQATSVFRLFAKQTVIELHDVFAIGHRLFSPTFLKLSGSLGTCVVQQKRSGFVGLLTCQTRAGKRFCGKIGPLTRTGSQPFFQRGYRLG